MNTQKDTLKQWFSNGKKPDEQQFWAWLESYWHKDEKIPIETIQDIQNILSGKANTELVSEILKKLDGKADAHTVQLLEDYVHALINDTISGVDTTYSSSKIDELISNLSPDIVENSTTTALTYEILQSTYPEARIGDVVICTNAGYKYEKTQKGWIQYVINKLFPIPVIKSEYKLAYSNISSPTLEEVNRISQIKITSADVSNKKFTCDLSNLEPLKQKGTNGEPWFIAQGSEASSFCELLSIDDAGFIYYSDAISSAMDMTVGKTIEFFNPFVNYQILNNQCPTLAIGRSNSNIFPGYSATLNGKTYKYIVNAGLIKKKSDNKYRVYLSAVGSGETFIAEDTNINGSFQLVSQIPFLENITYPNGRIKGTETLVWGVIPLEDAHLIGEGAAYIGLLSIKDISGNYTAYVYLDANGDLLYNRIFETKLFTSIDPNLHLTGLAFYKDQYHFLLKKWSTGNKLTNYTYHVITKDITKLGMNLDQIFASTDYSIIEKSYKLHQGSEHNVNNSILYGQGDFNLFTYNDRLYMSYFLEPLKPGFINTNNKMCGIAIWQNENNSWDYQKGLQLINPIQLFRKYPNLYWCLDHWGNLNNFYFENEEIYMGTTLGSGNSDFFPAILKMKVF